MIADELRRIYKECENMLYADEIRLKRLEEKVMRVEDNEVEGIISEITALREKIEDEATACVIARLKYYRANNPLMSMSP